jgi:hypothetical protein
MRWPRPIYAILPFVHILVGGAVLYRAHSFVGIAAGTLLVIAGAIILQMRHDYQHHPGGSEDVKSKQKGDAQPNAIGLSAKAHLKTEEQHQQAPGTK